nr:MULTISPECIES: IS21 family transposase [Myxococcaceae]
MVEGMKVETVARRFGVHHSTVRRALEEPEEAPARRPSIVDPFKDFLVQRLTEAPDISSVRLLAEARARGYPGGVAQLRRYVARVRAPVRGRKAYLRVEMEPGEQAQVDWGSFGSLRVGRSVRPLSAFLMVLSWSRALFVDFALDQRMETFLEMHRRALDFFGGVPRRILYDNLKSVVLHHAGATVQFNPRFLSFAGHYLFEPVAAPVRYPEAKGRVEGAVKYLRHSFFYGRTFSSLADVRQQAAAWRDETANARLHATTRERPAERLVLERPRLRALPARPYDTDFVDTCVVHKEARVAFDSNTYSVPLQHVGKTVQLRAGATHVRVLDEKGEEVAVHERCWDRRRALEHAEHLEKLLLRRPGAHLSHSRDRIAALCPEAPLYLREAARSRRSLKNEIERLTRLLERYGRTELSAGLVMAHRLKHYGAPFVQALMDQERFRRGQAEAPQPVLTGNTLADSLVVEPHPLETYDALFDGRSSDDARSSSSADGDGSDGEHHER